MRLEESFCTSLGLASRGLGVGALTMMNQSPSRQPSKQASVYGESEKAILGKVVLNLEPEFQFPNDAREALLFQVRNPYPPNAVPARSLEEEDYVEAVSVHGPDMESHHTPDPKPTS